VQYSSQDSLPLDSFLLISNSDLTLQAITAGIIHTIWVASQQLTINPTLSLCEHPSFTCNTETQRNISERLHVYAAHSTSDG